MTDNPTKALFQKIASKIVSALGDNYIQKTFNGYKPSVKSLHGHLYKKKGIKHDLVKLIVSESDAKDGARAYQYSRQPYSFTSDSIGLMLCVESETIKLSHTEKGRPQGDISYSAPFSLQVFDGALTDLLINETGSESVIASLVQTFIAVEGRYVMHDLLEESERHNLAIKELAKSSKDVADHFNQCALESQQAQTNLTNSFDLAKDEISKTPEYDRVKELENELKKARQLLKQASDKIYTKHKLKKPARESIDDHIEQLTEQAGDGIRAIYEQCSRVGYTSKEAKEAIVGILKSLRRSYRDTNKVYAPDKIEDLLDQMHLRDLLTEAEFEKSSYYIFGE